MFEFVKVAGGGMEARVRCEDVLETSMIAVIIYEHSNMGLKACTLLDRATQHAEGFPWEIHPWRMEMVLSSNYWELSHCEAARAHLIVFAVGGTTGLSPELSKWLELWAKERSVADAVLAIIDGGCGTDSSNLPATPLAHGLDQFVGRHGLCLLAGDVSPTNDDDFHFGTRISQHFSRLEDKLGDKRTCAGQGPTSHGR